MATPENHHNEKPGKAATQKLPIAEFNGSDNLIKVYTEIVYIPRYYFLLCLCLVLRACLLWERLYRNKYGTY
ncbi:MAG: hypothetical protein FWF85_02915 [Clostridiales bacterium]|jgi:hypothetical protein|nr:hypothetical protein [Clostridiales bacterium]MDR2712328.1 hypothetical protein [Clostridiales bacterium]